MDYTESQSYLEGVKKKPRIKFGLSVVSHVLNHDFFHEINRAKIIQVGGTNGKGSTCYFLSSILQKLGYRTGLFVSPHLINVRERISVGSRWISEKEFAKACSFIRDISEKLQVADRISRLPTYFEYLFLLAIYFFIMSKVDYIILEVGMGGRLDATTAVKPEISIITSISLDHERFLGANIKEIALEKAGIIKAGIPIVSYSESDSVTGEVIFKQAQKKRAPFFQVFNNRRILSKKVDHNYEYLSDHCYTFRLQNQGIHFAKNAACAIRSLEIMAQKGRLQISEKIIKEGLESVSIPGRIETILLPGKPEIILDVGHNPDSIRALSEILREKNIRDAVLVYGVLKEKKFRNMLDKLLEFVRIIVVTEPESELAHKGNLICEFLKESGKKVIYVSGSVSAFKKALLYDRRIIVTGSFYLVGPIRNFLVDEVSI
jgi:dihydrofolate synthase/folylpolyglutamate synthase